MSRAKETSDDDSQAKKKFDVDSQPANLSKPLTRRDTFFLMNPVSN